MLVLAWLGDIIIAEPNAYIAFAGSLGFLLVGTSSYLGFHSTHVWELMIGSVYKDFGFAQNDQIISGLVSTFPVILDTILKYWIFLYLNRVSPSLVVIYHSMND
ncbi:hypothetical protein RIF29_43240 [Crotalaria pallida]|uniref:Chloroplast envelope membrane protein n=1 Tax=Crotalaria pallida TaxID=3830 RepID=A0AAN9DZD6_CROPI